MGRAFDRRLAWKEAGRAPTERIPLARFEGGRWTWERRFEAVPAPEFARPSVEADEDLAHTLARVAAELADATYHVAGERFFLVPAVEVEGSRVRRAVDVFSELLLSVSLPDQRTAFESYLESLGLVVSGALARDPLTGETLEAAYDANRRIVRLRSSRGGADVGTLEPPPSLGKLL